MEIEELFDEFATLIGRALARRWLAEQAEKGNTGENGCRLTHRAQTSDPSELKQGGADSSVLGRCSNGLDEEVSLEGRPD